MIELYTTTTANCQKVNIAMCELGLDVRVCHIDIHSGAQKLPDHMERNPNGKVPVIVDTGKGNTIFESGAILLYLAELTGTLVPRDPSQRWQVIQWVFWQMAGLGPAGAQVIHFGAGAQRGEYALTRFRTELERLLKVLEDQLEHSEYIQQDYSMADIAVWPWVSRYDHLGLDLGTYPNLLRWYLRISERPAVVQGFQMLQPEKQIPLPTASKGSFVN